MSNSNNTTCPPQALFWFYKRSTVNPFHGNVLWEISLQSLTRKGIWVQLQCDKHCDWLEINHNIDFLQSQLFPIRGKQTLERTFLIKSKYISTFESFIYGAHQSFLNFADTNSSTVLLRISTIFCFLEFFCRLVFLQKRGSGCFLSWTKRLVFLEKCFLFFSKIRLVFLLGCFL